VVGDVKNENGSKDKGAVTVKRHLVLVVSDKFRDHEYLTTLEALVTSDRRVVLYNPLDTGQSQPLSPEQKEEIEADEGKALAFSVEELGDMWVTLQKELKVDQVHVFGHGFGALVANQRKLSISVVFCGQSLVSTESATSRQSATSQCLSALPARLVRGKFVLDGLGWKDKNQRTYYSYKTTVWCVCVCVCVRLGRLHLLVANKK